MPPSSGLNHATADGQPTPLNRLAARVAFEAVGADVFGPYFVAKGRSTWSEAGCSKVWGLLFTCLASRAVHVEVLDNLDITALRLALRWIVAIRGPVSLVRSDQGTNFVAAAAEANSLNLGPLSVDSSSPGCCWELLLAAAPHAGGVWERPVGSVKRALKGCFSSLAGRFSAAWSLTPFSSRQRQSSTTRLCGLCRRTPMTPSRFLRPTC